MRLIRKKIKAQFEKNVDVLLDTINVLEIAKKRYAEHIAIIAMQRAYRRRIRFNKAKRIIKRWLHKLSEEIRQTKQRNSLAHQMAKAMQDGEDEDNEDDENDDERKGGFHGWMHPAKLSVSALPIHSAYQRVQSTIRYFSQGNTTWKRYTHQWLRHHYMRW